MSSKSNRRKPLRSVLQWLSKVALGALTDIIIEGTENFPDAGPLLMVGNHFSFIDPVAFVSITPWPIEFVGGAVTPHAPAIVQFIPKLWGYLPVYRGTGSTYALKEAEKIIKRGGVIGIFPEGGSWAQVLRPARPGAAYLASQTGAKILPVGIDGLTEVFPTLKKFRRAKVKIKIGKPFGPFKIKKNSDKGRREQIDEYGHTIMGKIAELIPVDKGGLYSSDSAVREASKGTEYYPWEGTREGEDDYHGPHRIK